MPHAPSPSSRTPSYRWHKPTNQAVVTRNGRDYYLGRYGSKESKAQYDRLIAEWLACGRWLPGADRGLSMNEVRVAYLRYAAGYHKADGDTRTLYSRVLNQAGDKLLNEEVPSEPAARLEALALFRSDPVVAAECTFAWYWLADPCASEKIAFVLGHAPYVKAIHGGAGPVLQPEPEIAPAAVWTVKLSTNWFFKRIHSAPSVVRPLDGGRPSRS